MPCNSSSSSRDREPTGILPSITYFLLASNGIGAIFRAYAGGNYSMAAFIIIIYFGFLLMESCLSAYQRLPPHEESRTKRFLKLAIWLLFSAIMFGFAHQIAPFLSLAAGLLLYATAAACSAFLLCVCIICEGISNKDCAKCCTEEKRYFSCCACHVEEVISDEKLIQDYDSILEKV